LNGYSKDDLIIKMLQILTKKSTDAANA